MTTLPDFYKNNHSICNKNSSLKEVLQYINHEPAGIAFITDDNQKLCGVLTDGDFRRILLAGAALEDTIPSQNLKNFTSAEEGESIEELIKKTNKIVRIIPILNKKGYITDYFRYEHKTHITPVAEPSLKGNEFKYLSDAFLSTWISSKGKYIDKFESEFANYIGTKHGVTTSNGTTALHLALKALKIGRGDEVIVPDLTFAATINCVLHAEATPVIVDVNKDFWTICPDEIEKAITPKTKAIIPVHIYGQPAEMDKIMAIAKKNNLYVVEDCAESHGASFNSQTTGTFGDISCYSFFGNKIITTGEGGMCLTNNPHLDERMRMLRDHGMSKTKRYWHDEVGFNYRITNLQAAIGVAQLEKIEQILLEREAIEKKYMNILAQIPFIEWQKTNDARRQKVVWLVAAIINEGKRDEFIKLLRDNLIDVRPFFYSLGEMDIYKKYLFSNKNSLEISKKGINLPTIAQVNVEKIKQLILEKFHHD